MWVTPIAAMHWFQLFLVCPRATTHRAYSNGLNCPPSISSEGSWVSTCIMGHWLSDLFFKRCKASYTAVLRLFYSSLTCGFWHGDWDMVRIVKKDNFASVCHCSAYSRDSQHHFWTAFSYTWCSMITFEEQLQRASAFVHRGRSLVLMLPFTATATLSRQ